jgi:hypothetical protein
MADYKDWSDGELAIAIAVGILCYQNTADLHYWDKTTALVQEREDRRLSGKTGSDPLLDLELAPCTPSLPNK